MKPAVAYIRVSKEKSEGVSPSTQLSKIRAYCDIHDLQLIDMYRDLDISGRRAENRPGLQEMMRRIERGDVRSVVAYKIDRLARSVRDFHQIMHRLEESNCDLVSVSQNIDTSSPVGRLLRNVLVDFAQFESEMIGERLSDTFHHVVSAKGKWLGGAPPTGYRQTPKGLVVHEQEAELVRGIFEEYVSGIGTRALAGRLNARRVPTPSGGRLWRYSTVSWMLKNPAYAGRIVWDGQEYAGNHEPIVNEETFQAAQRMMRLNNHNPGHPRGERVLSGLMRCGLCGGSGNVKHGRGTVRYICVIRSQQDKSACANVQIDEPTLVRRVRALFHAGSDLRAIVTEEKKIPEEKRRDAEAELAEIDRRLGQLKNRMDKLFEDRYERDAITTEQFAEMNRRYLEEEAALSERRESLREAAGAVDAHEGDERVMQDATDALAASWDGMTIAERRLALSLVIREIVWTPDGADIVWQWGGKTVLTYSEVRRGVAVL